MDKSTVYIIRQEKDKPNTNYGFLHVQSAEVFWQTYKNISLQYWMFSLCINQKGMTLLTDEDEDHHFNYLNVLLTRQDIELLKKDIETNNIYSYTVDRQPTEKQEMINTHTFCSRALFEYYMNNVCFYINTGH